MAQDPWPALPYDAWKDTYATLHMWSQIAGKIALARLAPVEDSRDIAFDVTTRGLSTRTLPYGDRSFSVAFDFIDHRFVIDASDGDRRVLPLAPRTVADFYREVMAALDEMALPVKIWPMPIEVPDPIRFTDDTVHRSYDPSFANRFWRILVSIQQTLLESRRRVTGECSPPKFFWDGFDLAMTRFSGQRAPAHEAMTHGFRPGRMPVIEPAFYAAAVPPPERLEPTRILPDGAYYRRDLGEFVLPYEVVRTAASPERAIMQFIDSTSASAVTADG
jgi:hypothetical protein